MAENDRILINHDNILKVMGCGYLSYTFFSCLSLNLISFFILENWEIKYGVQNYGKLSNLRIMGCGYLLYIFLRCVSSNLISFLILENREIKYGVQNGGKLLNFESYGLLVKYLTLYTRKWNFAFSRK